jgi:Protein of unknown function (DUF732)
VADLGIRSSLITDPRNDALKSLRLLAIAALVAMGLFGAVAFPSEPSAHADAVAYLVNVTVRPGYHFANADDALAYGRSICDKVAQGRGYAQIMGEVKADFQTADEYQASYLISQAVNEPCPASIRQLRNSAAHY